MIRYTKGGSGGTTLPDLQKQEEKQKKGEKKSFLATAADAAVSAGKGGLKAVENSLDSAASLATWYARIFGMDKAEREINDFIGRDLTGEVTGGLENYLKDRGSALQDREKDAIVRARSAISPMRSLVPATFKPTDIKARESMEPKTALPAVNSTIEDIRTQAGVGMAKSVEGVVDAIGTSWALGLKAIGANKAAERLKEHVAKDRVGNGSEYADYYMENGSVIGNGGGGTFVRDVAQGVGQMLPSVAASVLTGGSSLAANAVLGVSAAGGGVEEALQEGADLGKATLYGLANAGVEVGMERLSGGTTKAIFGKGMLDDVTSSLAKTSAGRVVKSAIGEGIEEGATEALNPALKSIYKGVDAFREYEDLKQLGKNVGKAALVGAGTSVAFGGTVGAALGTSGKAADIDALKEDIAHQEQKRAEMFRDGKMTEGDANDKKTAAAMLDDVNRMQKILKALTPQERSRLIAQYDLQDLVSGDGSVRDDVLRSLTIEDADNQTHAENQNASQSEKTGLTGAPKYVSQGLWRKDAKITADLAAISRTVSARTKAQEGVTLHKGDLTENESAAYKAFSRAASKLSQQSGNRMQFALVDAPEIMKGVRRGDTVYLNAKTLEDGEWAGVLLEEATHFTQGTREANAYMNFLAQDSALIDEIMEDLLKEGNAYGFTDENVLGDRKEEFDRELYGHASAKLLNDSAYIDKLVRADRTLAEKIKNGIEDVIDVLRGYVGSGGVEVRKQLRRANKAVQMFEGALGEADDHDGEVAYSLKRDADGNAFVDVTDDIFDGNDGESVARTIQRVIAERFNNLIDVHGQKIQINKTTNDEFRRSESATTLLENSPEAYNDKLKTIANADEIVAVAKNWIGEKLNHTRKDDIIEFARGNVTYRVGGNGYVADVIVGTRKNGATVLYDLVNIYEKEIAEAPVTMASHNDSQRRQDASAKNSIPQNPEMSTPEMDFSFENSANAEDRSANQQAAVEKKKRTTVEDVARELERYANIKRGHRNELLQMLSALYSDIEAAHITAEEMAPRLREIADFIMENRKETKMERDAFTQSLLDTLEGSRITLTKAQKEAVLSAYEKFEDWREQMKGGVSIVNKGTPLDVIWKKWAEKFPNIFKDMTETDMPGELLRIYKGAKESVDMSDAEGTELYDAEGENISAQLPAMIADAFWRVDKKISAEYRAMLKAISEKMDAKEAARAAERAHKEELREVDKKNTLAKHIQDGVSHLATKSNDTNSRFFSPATYRSDQTKIVFAELSKVDYSSANTGSVRTHIKTLAEWYGAKENYVFADTFERDSEIQAILDGIAGEKESKALSIQELEALAKVVSYFRAISDLMQTIVKNGERVDAKELATEMVKQIRESKLSVTTAVSIARKMLGEKENVNYWTLFGRPETVAKIADNFADGFFSYIFGEAQTAEVKRDKLRIELARDVEKYLSKDRKYLGRLEKGEITFRGQTMTVAEALQLYLLLGRPQAQVHLAVGGFETYQGDKRVKHAPVGNITYRLNEVPAEIIEKDAAVACENARKELESVLTQQDLDFAELLREKYNGAMKQAKIKGDKQKQGYSNVEKSEQYVPMMIAQKVQTADLNYTYLEKVDRYAFNKQVYQMANNALLIMPAHKVFARHAMDLATYVEIRPVVESFNILYNLDIKDNRRNPETIKTVVERSGGFEAKAAGYFKDILTDLQGDRHTDRRAEGLNVALGKIRKNYALSTLAFNVNSWLSQLSSYLAAGSELNVGAMTKGARLLSQKGVTNELIDQYSDVAMVRAYEGYAAKAQTLLDKMSEPASKLMNVTTALDRFVVRRLWAACLVQVTGSIEAAQNASEAQLQEAGKLLDRVILKTQQNAMATTRSGAMRSNNELAKALTMFSADNMMGTGQAIEATLKVAALKRKMDLALKDAKTEQEREALTKEYTERIKEAKIKSAKAVASMASSAVYLAVVSMMLQALRGTLKDDEDESVAKIFLVTAVGNAMGGLPAIRDIYSRFFEGYDMDIFAIEAFNNMCGSVEDMALLLGDVIAGKDVEGQEVARKTRSLLYSIGTMLGMPIKNVYNNVRTVVGVIGLFDKRLPYNVDNVFYAQSYSKDLEKALLAGDDKMVNNIVNLMLGKNGDGMSEGTSRAISKLIKQGESGILPRSIPETLIDAKGNEVELSGKQRKRFEQLYEAAYRSASDLTRTGSFKAATSDEQAEALKYIWDTYYQLAKDAVLGEESTKKAVLFAEAIPVEQLALIKAKAGNIKADVDRNGNAINGSRLTKIESMVRALNLSAAQKHMVLGYLGYKNKKGQGIVTGYIATLRLSQAEKAELLEMSGYPGK